MIASIERILVAAVLCALAYLYVDQLHDKLAAADRAAGEAREAIASRDQTITTLTEAASTQAQAVSRIAGERDAIRAQLSNREIEMRKLQDENAEVRAWAAAAVPDPVTGLRDHPTITGAAAYRELLSKGAALPAAGSAGAQ